MPPTKKKTNLESLIDTAQGLTTEERAELARQGFSIPAYLSTDAADRNWGYRCRHCGKVALEFLGSRWGEHESPQKGMQIHTMLWVQPRGGKEHVDRRFPTCQYCHAAVHLIGGGLHEKDIVYIPKYVETIDTIRERGREAIRGTPPDLPGRSNPDPSAREVAESAAKSEQQRAAEAGREAITPDQINELADAYDLTGKMRDRTL